MKKLLTVAAMALLAACASVQRSSSFTTETIQPGMTKAAVISKYGKPYKESFTYDDNKQVKTEVLYYKEHIFRKQWYEINTMMHFADDKLVKVETGEEKRVDGEVIVERR